MLVAKRDPFDPAAQNPSHSDFAAHSRARPRFARTMTALQMLGTLLGIPLALASGYTMYRVNFSPEASCQTLRSTIVSMLDKSVDARTRHMLVRKDVEKFEQTCSSVDPDATAAFKALLDSDRRAASRPRVESKPVAEKARETEAVRKSDPKKEAHEAAVPEKPEPHDTTMSDTAWLAAVRGALTADDAAAPKVAPAQMAPVSAPAAHEAGPKPELRTSLPPAPPPISAPPATAPVLPPAANVATVPAAPPDADHPVPPAAVPMIAESRPHGWVGHIPFVGQMLDSK